MGDAADAAAPVVLFAFFFLAFFAPDLAGAGAVADAEGADDPAIAEPCASAATENAAATGAATRYFFKKRFLSRLKKDDTGIPCRRH